MTDKTDKEIDDGYATAIARSLYHQHQYTIPVESETTHEVDFIKEGEYREYDQTIVTVLRCQCGEETTR